MKIAIVDARADEKAVYNLENAGLHIIPTMILDNLYDAVASHADMQIHYLGKKRFVCAPETFEHYKNLLPKEFILIKGSKCIGSKYPYDVPYNVAALNDFVICNTRYTAIEILSEYKSMGKDILNVRQGYSKCSTAIISGNAIITADESIYQAAEKHKINVLKIDTGYIELRGMSYGFIGGATGLIDEHTLAVNGDIKKHPDAKKIEKFCKCNNIELLSLNNGILKDIGSIITNFDI